MKGHSEVAMVHDTTSPCELWHRRLAHINYKALPHVKRVEVSFPYMKVEDKGVWKGCVKGKNMKNQFPKSNTKT